MNDYLLSFVLGIIEGLTEFLPVSSTAHLRVSQVIFGVNLSDGYWKMFSIVIQLGAILVLPIYFWSRILRFLRTFPNGARGDKTPLTHPLTLIALAFLITAIPSYLLHRAIDRNLESIRLMGFSLIIGGIVMWVVDWRYGGHKGLSYATGIEEIEHMGPAHAVWIGFCQFLSAFFPGTSRSMATIAGGQVSGLSRTAALEFSFLLSIPTMAAATGYSFLKALKPPAGEVPVHIDSHGAVLLAIGFLVSFIVAFAVVAWFMNWVRNRGFTAFAVYRIIVGAAVLLFLA